MNAWNALPAIAFDCERMNGFKSFLDHTMTIRNVELS